MSALRDIMNMFHRRHKASVGDRSYIDRTAQFTGSKRIRIGKHCAVGADTWLNVNDWHSPGYAIEIGDFCFIARRNFFTAGAHIRIGDYCLTGPDCHFLGAGHALDDPMIPYAIAQVVTDSKIDVGVNCWLGAKVTVLKGVKIGHGSIIGAASLVTRDVPPFCMVMGAPAKIVKRYRFAEKRWIPVTEWNASDEAALPSENDYLKTLQTTHSFIRLPLAACSPHFGHQ